VDPNEIPKLNLLVLIIILLLHLLAGPGLDFFASAIPAMPRIDKYIMARSDSLNAFLSAPGLPKLLLDKDILQRVSQHDL